MSKRFLKKRQVAERYGISERETDRRVRDGRLPAPYYHSRFPRWDEDELDACDRVASRERPVPSARKAAADPTPEREATEAAG
jgi:predicted DNA-binding transcriptional regulator AlpA